MLRIYFIIFSGSLLMSLIIFPTSSSAQVYGCTDPQASNYNSSATLNNGSCTYNTTNYTPPVKVDPISNTLQETSGLQYAGGFLWSFNDGGGQASIYKIDTASNAILQTVNLAGATNVDWEDIAFDGTHFYVGDFGNNADGARTDLKVYKFPLSAIPDHATDPLATIPVGQISVISFTYSNQPQPPVATASNATKYDCEAMIADNGKIHLFSKNWVDNNTTHYIINGTASGNYVADSIETLATNYLVTAADKSPGFNIITLLGYQVSGFANHYLHILSDYKADSFFTGNKRRIDLPNALVMGQAEGLTFRNATYGYISNEKFSIVNQKLRSFNINDFISQVVLAVGLQNFDVQSIDNRHKISWQFASIVNNLSVQYSIDAVNFSPLIKYPVSSAGEFINANISANNYYRLAWQKDDGTHEYSKVIAAKKMLSNLLGNLSIDAEGRFAFTSAYASTCTFRFTSVDGKVLQTLANHTCVEGANTVHLPGKFRPNSLVIVSVYNNGKKESKVLLVSK